MNVPVPAALRRSPLMAAGGWRVLRRWPDRRLAAALLEDAASAFGHASETCVASSDGEEHRGGSPKRRFLSAAASSLQESLYRDAGLAAGLAETAGLPLRPTGRGGTYSYYLREGDFLGIHRDIVTCDVALITCLLDDGPPGHAGANCLWPTRLAEPLSALRADPCRDGVVLRLEPGDSLLLLGGIVPHAVLPVRAGQRRVVSLLCFEALVEGGSDQARGPREPGGPRRRGVRGHAGGLGAGVGVVAAASGAGPGAAGASPG